MEILVSGFDHYSLYSLSEMWPWAVYSSVQEQRYLKKQNYAVDHWHPQSMIPRRLYLRKTVNMSGCRVQYCTVKT
jgi:hypothetical protein